MCSFGVNVFFSSGQCGFREIQLFRPHHLFSFVVRNKAGSEWVKTVVSWLPSFCEKTEELQMGLRRQICNTSNGKLMFGMCGALLGSPRASFGLRLGSRGWSWCVLGHHWGNLGLSHDCACGATKHYRNEGLFKFSVLQASRCGLQRVPRLHWVGRATAHEHMTAPSWMYLAYVYI